MWVSCSAAYFTYFVFVSILTLKGVYADYGFHFPRATDILWLGQTVNLTWACKDDFIQIALVFADWNTPIPQVDPVIVTGKIPNKQWFEWTIPTDISEDLVKRPHYLALANGVTEGSVFVSESLTLRQNESQSQSEPIAPKDSRLGRFTSPVRIGTAIKEGSALNITWESKAQYVKMSIVVPGASTRKPDSLFDTIKNRGYYYWDRLQDHGWGQAPQFFRLESNDTEFLNMTLDSESFYVEPSAYPTTTLSSLATPSTQFIYPLNNADESDMTEVYNLDTITFQWWPPLPKDTNLVMTAVCGTRWYNQMSTLHTGRTSFANTNLTWQLPPRDEDEDPEHPEYHTFYNCPIHFNLLQTRPMTTKWDWTPMKLIARTDKFIFKGQGEIGAVRYIAPEKLSIRRAQSEKSQGGLAWKYKILIGVLVPVIISAIFIIVVWQLWKKRKRFVKEEEAKKGGDVTHEIGEGERYKKEGQSTLEADGDTFYRELEDTEPVAQELEADSYHKPHEADDDTIYGELEGSEPGAKGIVVSFHAIAELEGDHKQRSK